MLNKVQAMQASSNVHEGVYDPFKVCIDQYACVLFDDLWWVVAVFAYWSWEVLVLIINAYNISKDTYCYLHIVGDSRTNSFKGGRNNRNESALHGGTFDKLEWCHSSCYFPIFMLSLEDSRE